MSHKRSSSVSRAWWATLVAVALGLTIGLPSAAAQALPVRVRPLPVQPAVATSVDFVGASHSDDGSKRTKSVTVPATAQPGDTMVLFFTHTAATTWAGPSGVSGWTQAATMTQTKIESTMWSKTVASGDPGKTVTLTSSAAHKAVLSLAVYSGVNAVGVPSHSGSEKSASHVSPVVTAAEGDLVMTYYADQSAATTSWTAPAGVTQRDVSTQTGTGRFGSLWVDSGAGVPAGGYGGLTATTNAVSTHAVAWTVGLSPTPGGPPVNQPPTARFTWTVSGLTASLDGSTSNDSDGSIVSYDWDFGDGETSTDEQPVHTYDTAGAKPVTLTVTDDDGATGVVQHTVTVSNGTPPSGPCGTLPYDAANPPSYDHIVVIMDENRSPSELTPTTAPFLTDMGQQCGSEGFMHAATHASDPNYMAATSGLPTPMGTMRTQDNVLHQAQVAGDTWTSYQETMVGNCGPNRDPYSSWHDPAHWYTDLRSPVNTCATRDVPLAPRLANDLANDALPTYSWITPDNCDNMHWKTYCPQPESQAIFTGDQWLKQVVGEITATPSYQAGRTLIILTWDEGSGKAIKGSDCTLPSVYNKQPSCQIPTYVISPYIVPGVRDNSDHNLYGLLATTEDILGYPRLARAVDQTSMRTGLGF